MNEKRARDIRQVALQAWNRTPEKERKYLMFKWDCGEFQAARRYYRRIKKNYARGIR